MEFSILFIFPYWSIKKSVSFFTFGAGEGNHDSSSLHFFKDVLQMCPKLKKKSITLSENWGGLGVKLNVKIVTLFIKWRVPFLRLSIKDIKKSVHESFYGAGVFVLDYIMCRHNIIRSIDTDISIHISLWTGSSVSQHSHCIVTIINCITTKQQALSAVSPLWLWKLRDQ